MTITDTLNLMEVVKMDLMTLIPIVCDADARKNKCYLLLAEELKIGDVIDAYEARNQGEEVYPAWIYKN